MSKKEAYQQKLQAQIEEQKAELTKLKAKAKRHVAEGKIAAHDKVEELEAQLDQLKGKLTEFKQAGEDAWEDAKEGLETSWNSLRESVKKAFSKDE